jgi:hypothetical protein
MKVSKINIIIGIILAIAIISAIIIILRNAAIIDKKTTIGDVFKYDLSEFTKTDPNLIKQRIKQNKNRITESFCHRN